jgi:hypothetical protein
LKADAIPKPLLWDRYGPDPRLFCPAASVTGMVISIASLLSYQGERRNVAVIEITIKMRARFLTSPTIPFSPAGQGADQPSCRSWD